MLGRGGAAPWLLRLTRGVLGGCWVRSTRQPGLPERTESLPSLLGVGWGPRSPGGVEGQASKWA